MVKPRGVPRAQAFGSAEGSVPCTERSRDCRVGRAKYKLPTTGHGPQEPGGLHLTSSTRAHNKHPPPPPPLSLHKRSVPLLSKLLHSAGQPHCSDTAFYPGGEPQWDCPEKRPRDNHCDEDPERIHVRLPPSRFSP